MDEEYFVDDVQVRSPFGDRGPTRRAVLAVIETLGERLPAHAARALADVLPEELQGGLLSEHAGEAFPLPEFLSRVSGRAGIGHHEAVRHTQLALGLLDEMTPEREIDGVQAALPDGYGVLFELVQRRRNGARP